MIDYKKGLCLIDKTFFHIGIKISYNNKNNTEYRLWII